MQWSRVVYSACKYFMVDSTLERMLGQRQSHNTWLACSQLCCNNPKHLSSVTITELHEDDIRSRFQFPIQMSYPSTCKVGKLSRMTGFTCRSQEFVFTLTFCELVLDPLDIFPCALSIFVSTCPVPFYGEAAWKLCSRALKAADCVGLRVEECFCQMHILKRHRFSSRSANFLGGKLI